MAELQPGTYRLTREVANPEPDRRQRYDWRALVTMEKGTLFVVETRHPGVTVIRRQNGSLSEPEGMPLFEAIAPYLEPVTERPTDLLARRGYVHNMRGHVLDRLFAAGKVTLADVESALNEIEAEE